MRTPPPIGPRPAWIGIEHWMQDHPHIRWIAVPFHYIAITWWRKKLRHRWKR